MNEIGKPERATQERVIKLFVDELGYRYLSDWSDRDGNSNVETGILSAWLAGRGNTPAQIGAALYKLRTEADNYSRNLYANNEAVYKLLRYGVPVKTDPAKPTETVKLVDWEEPEKNDFAIAEEVTLKGNLHQSNLERRPDLVLYINGIAIGVIELKNSRVSIGDGIRQSLARIFRTSSRSSTPGSSRRCSSSLPATTPKGCAMAPFARRKNTSCAGRKTRKTTAASSWTSICSRCAARTGSSS